MLLPESGSLCVVCMTCKLSRNEWNKAFFFSSWVPYETSKLSVLSSSRWTAIPNLRFPTTPRTGVLWQGARGVPQLASVCGGLGRKHKTPGCFTCTKEAGPFPELSAQTPRTTWWKPRDLNRTKVSPSTSTCPWTVSMTWIQVTFIMHGFGCVFPIGDLCVLLFSSWSFRATPTCRFVVR